MAIVVSAHTALAKPTAEQQCQSGKNVAAGKLAACLQSAEAKLANTGDTAKYAQTKLDCSYKFARKWMQLEAEAAKAGVTCPDAPLTQSALESAIQQCSANVATALAGGGLFDCAGSLNSCLADLGATQSAQAACATALTAAEGDLAACQVALAACNVPTSTPTPMPPTVTPTPTSTPVPRFVDNGDGTVTDNLTGLQWEQKTNLDFVSNASDPHDADNLYSWGPGTGSPQGTAFKVLLPALNAGAGFAGHKDWRLPSRTELESILLEPYPCGTRPCIHPIFGPTKGTFEGGNPPYYWTASIPPTYDCCDVAYFVRFDIGATEFFGSSRPEYVRAVRTIQ